MYMCMYMHMYMHMCMYMHMYMCTTCNMCMYVHVHVHVVHVASQQSVATPDLAGPVRDPLEMRRCVLLLSGLLLGTSDARLVPRPQASKRNDVLQRQPTVVASQPLEPLAPFRERLCLEVVRNLATILAAWVSTRTITGRISNLMPFSANDNHTKVAHVAMNISTRFADVEGCDEVKHELEEAVAYLKDPASFRALGAKLPAGYLLEGAPGTGKTLLARAVAGEAGVPFVSVSASAFDEKYVGVGAKRVRDIFAAARKVAPAIVFIDELDAVGAARGGIDRQVHAQTLNALLVELDGFDGSGRVLVLAATNQLAILDRALTRPGRFDRTLHVNTPDIGGRRALLRRMGAALKLDAEVDLDRLATSTAGLTGADLASILNGAAIRAAAEREAAVSSVRIEEARDKVLMGLARPSAVVSEEQRKLAAVHEAGHALVARYTRGAKPVEKLTIVPHGAAAGLTLFSGEDTAGLQMLNQTQVRAELAVLLGGRAAELFLFGAAGLTTGAENDLARARTLATHCTLSWGFDAGVGEAGPGADPGALCTSLADAAIDVGLSTAGVRDESSLSEASRQQVDCRVGAALCEAQRRAGAVLSLRRAEHEALVAALLEKDALNAQELDAVLAAVETCGGAGHSTADHSTGHSLGSRPAELGDDVEARAAGPGGAEGGAGGSWWPPRWWDSATSKTRAADRSWTEQEGEGVSDSVEL